MLKCLIVLFFIYLNFAETTQAIRWVLLNELLYYKLKKTFKERIKVQNPFLIKGKLYYADISIPSLKLIIEVDGGYHSTPEQQVKDKQRDEAFKSIGYTTLRFTNEQVASKDGKKKILEEILTYKNNYL